MKSVLTIALMAGLAACSGTTITNNQVSLTGGSTGTSTVATGGSRAVGGSSATGGGATGGAVATGGVATGGAVSSGGATAGGTTATGGLASTGGVATGGATASGGVAAGATGGAVITGGAVATGGAATSGSVSTGGAATGGALSNGGTATSGSSTGGSATGGAVSTGGAATGGISATGGGSAGSGCTGSFETVQSITGLCVAKMVPITAPTASQNYSIDVTEVTKGQYEVWLATNPALPPTTEPTCGYVYSYSEQGGRDIYSGTDSDHHPVVYVDWCDAYAYCAGVGKRLCGAIGGGSMPWIGIGLANDETQGQWFRACTSGGANTYPYGNTYQATYCDGADYWNNSSTEQTVAVGSLTNCVTSASGYSGVYDLSGNVFEWQDSADTAAAIGAGATCRFQGGAYYAASSQVSCDFAYGAVRNGVYPYIGFRCCSP
jgi:sulfatase modifying factor 1